MDVLGRLLEAVGKDSEVSDRVHCALAVHAHLPSSFGNDRVDSLLETAALDVDADDLTELWWAVQGMVEVEDRVGERTVRLWWRELWAEPQVELDHHRADAEAKRRWTPAEDYRVPSLRLFVLANEIRLILRRLLGASWRVDYRPEIGLRDPIEGRPAEVMIELRVVVEEGDSERPSELTATFACPEPVARPAAPKPTTRPKTEAMPPDVAWILTAVEAMPARERASVAAFIHGLREGASLYSENNRPSP